MLQKKIYHVIQLSLALLPQLQTLSLEFFRHGFSKDKTKMTKCSFFKSEKRKVDITRNIIAIKTSLFSYRFYE